MKNYTFSCILITLVFTFVTSLWVVDIGASLQFLRLKGIDVVAGGLLFANVEPRIIYHFGLLLASVSFMSLCALALYSKFEEECK